MPFNRYEYWKNYRTANATKFQLKRTTKIKPVSKKLSKMKVIYGHIRKDYLEENPYCQARIPGCTIEATEIHHAKGREGNLLNDVSHFKAVCRHCHLWIEGNPVEAKEKGLSVERLAI